MKVILGPFTTIEQGEHDMPIRHERFTDGEVAGLADLLEGFNKPGNQGTALRRLTDLLWELQANTDAYILTTDREELR